MNVVGEGTIWWSHRYELVLWVEHIARNWFDDKEDYWWVYDVFTRAFDTVLRNIQIQREKLQLFAIRTLWFSVRIGRELGLISSEPMMNGVLVEKASLSHLYCDSFGLLEEERADKEVQEQNIWNWMRQTVPSHLTKTLVPSYTVRMLLEALPPHQRDQNVEKTALWLLDCFNRRTNSLSFSAECVGACAVACARSIQFLPPWDEFFQEIVKWRDEKFDACYSHMQRIFKAEKTILEKAKLALQCKQLELARQHEVQSQQQRQEVLHDEEWKDSAEEEEVVDVEEAAIDALVAMPTN